jgi:hypothetical protein
MILTPQQRKITPMALTGKVLAVIGAIILALGVVFAGVSLLARLFTSAGAGSVLALVFGLLAGIFAGIGLVLLLVGVVLRGRPANSPSGNVVDAFYAALARQDYQAACQYLAANTQPLTLETFTQRAQEADARLGRVTDYALSGIKTQSGSRYFTMKVTRAGGSYRATLRLQDYGSEWKILGFDRL